MATIEERYSECGFVYTNRTRMLFTPKFTATRLVADQDSTDLVLSASNHATPIKADITECIAALRKRFPDRNLFLEGERGLVPVYEKASS
jgi:hypothetical protein